jgi:hypothetical protein
MHCPDSPISRQAPGHDVWIVGDEPGAVIDRQGYVDHAKH